MNPVPTRPSLVTMVHEGQGFRIGPGGPWACECGAHFGDRFVLADHQHHPTECAAIRDWKAQQKKGRVNKTP